MANIKTIKRSVLGEEVSFAIKVDSAGQFSTSYPHVIRDRCPSYNRATYKTLDALITDIDRMCAEVDALETSVEYILVYEVRVRSTPERWTENYFKAEVIWTPYKKTTVGKDVTYNYMSYDTFKHSKCEGPVPEYYALANEWSPFHRNGTHRPVADPEKGNVLPWTPENLSFFLRIGQQMRDLNKMIENFLEPESVQKFITEQMPLRLAARSEK